MATTTTTTTRPPSKLYDLEVTILSAKHLKNVNWRNGDLKPYVILWVDPDRRQATKPDDFGSTRPVWNERFVFPLTLPPKDSILTLEIFHSKPSETPKPLIGTVRFEIRDLMVESGQFENPIRNLELRRPSGRPHGKIRIKVSLIEHPVENYHTAPHSPYYYSLAPSPPPYRHSPSLYSSVPPSPPPPPQPYYSYSDPQSRYYSYYSAPPPPPRPFYERQSGYGGPGPSAPVDYTPYDYHKRGGGSSGLAGALGGLALEEEYIAERVEGGLGTMSRGDRYGEYRTDY